MRPWMASLSWTFVFPISYDQAARLHSGQELIKWLRGSNPISMRMKSSWVVSKMSLG